MVKKMQQPLLPTEPIPAAYEPSATDIISDLLSQVLAMAPEFSAALAAQIERDAREKWGGDRVYVQRKGGTLSHRNAAIKRDYRAGERVPLLSRRYGLSTPRLWEIINL